MNSAEIECIMLRYLDSLGVRFAGVFAADRIELGDDYPSCFVVNTDPAHKPGQHWVACYAKSRSELEFFDSYGMPAYAYPHIRLPLRVSVFNGTSLQAVRSYACGHYCIYYLCMRARGSSFAAVVGRMAVLSPALREQVVRKFVFRITGAMQLTRPCRGPCVGMQCCEPREM